jgi:flagellar protein FliT
MGQLHDLMHCYESLATLTARMLSAARVDDWEAVDEMDGEYRRLVNDLRPPHISMRLNDQQRARKYVLVRQILADDAAIRDLADPQMARMSSLLAYGHRLHTLSDPYGGGEPRA